MTTKVFLSNADPANRLDSRRQPCQKQLDRTQAVVFKNRIWLLGGTYGGDITGKVWKMGPGTE